MNITNNIALERYECLVCLEFYKTQFKSFYKKLWSQDHTKVSFEKTFKTLKSNLLKLNTLLQTTKPNPTVIQEKNETFSSGQTSCKIQAQHHASADISDHTTGKQRD